MNNLRHQTLRGAELLTQLDAVAAMRIRVFRDWPYLYEGTLDYERHYLETYARCAESLAVVVWQGEQVVGATTALPLTAAALEMQQPFLHDQQPLHDTLYLGESVVLPACRGLGLGVAFFQHREAHARQLGLRRAVFCAVERPAQHPLKPVDYRGNEAFWNKRGYTPTELRCRFNWQDVGAPALTEKILRYWQKPLP